MFIYKICKIIIFIIELLFIIYRKVHVYDKETIPVNLKSAISNLTLEKKSLEAIKKVVQNSRDTLNKLLEQLEKVKVEESSAPTAKEIKPLSNAELNEFLGEQDDTTKTTVEGNYYLCWYFYIFIDIRYIPLIWYCNFYNYCIIPNFFFISIIN